MPVDSYAVDYGTWTYGKTQIAPAPTPAPTLPQIKRLQDALAELPQLDLPPEHLFTPGMYIRKLAIPADSVVVGKMHRHCHPVMLIKGKTTILTDNGMETMEAPQVWVSPAGIKRVLYTHTDCEFVTVHLNPDDETDLEKLEADIIIPDAQIDYSPAALGQFKDELQEMYA